MAYAFKNTFEGGSNGSGVTAGNSGGASGDAFSFVIVGTGASIQYATLPWGGQGAKITHGSTDSYVRWDDSSVTSGDTRRIGRKPIWLDGEIANNILEVRALTATDQNMGALFLIGDNGTHRRKLQLADASHAYLTPSRSTTVLDLNTLYWVELVVGSGASSNGILGWRLLAADGVTEIETYTNSAITTRADPPARAHFGRANSTGMAVEWLDDLRWEAKASGWLGPLSAPAPVLSISDDVKHVIDARASTVATGSLDFSISQDSGPSVTPVEVSGGLWHVTPHATETLVYEVTASGSLGGSTNTTVEVPPLGVAATGPRVVRHVMIDGDLV